MSLILRVIASIALALLVGVGILVASSHLLPLLSVGVLVAVGALGLRPANRRPLSGFEAVQYVVAITAAFVAAIYAAIGTSALLGNAFLAVSGVCALAYLGNRWRCRVSQLESRRGLRGGRGLLPGGDSERGGRMMHPGFGTKGSASGSPAAEGGDTTSARLLPPDPAGLSIDELCRAWRVSFLELKTAHGPNALENVTQLRRRYLDELCYRDPEGFHQWLDDGARAAGDPSRYIRQRGQ